MKSEIFKINYERACELTELLYKFLIDKLPCDIHLEYKSSYLSYFKLSDFNEPEIFLNIKGCKNACISVGAFLVERELPFILHLWKYIPKFDDDICGHITKNIYFCDSLSDDDFCLWCLDYINEFYCFDKINKAYEQISLFDFI